MKGKKEQKESGIVKEKWNSASDFWRWGWGWEEEISFSSNMHGIESITCSFSSPSRPLSLTSHSTSSSTVFWLFSSCSCMMWWSKRTRDTYHVMLDIMMMMNRSNLFVWSTFFRLLYFRWWGKEQRLASLLSFRRLTSSTSSPLFAFSLYVLSSFRVLSSIRVLSSPHSHISISIRLFIHQMQVTIKSCLKFWTDVWNGVKCSLETWGVFKRWRRWWSLFSLKVMREGGCPIIPFHEF